VVHSAGRGEPGPRDFLGLFPALLRTAPARAAPADVLADGALGDQVRAHAAACAAACGAPRLRELAGLIARTLDLTENLAA
jgi:hypothetical protein